MTLEQKTEKHLVGSQTMRAIFLAGTATLASSALAVCAHAQDVADDSSPQTLATGATAETEAGQIIDGDTIVVTGIRASLDRAISIKRNSVGVVDAISAEDIGKFPDTNLAESLQRIPGVTIDRVNGEGSQVTVRGFGPSFNLVTLNGRQLPTANVSAVGGDQDVDFSRATSRSFDFSNLASEGVRTLEVYKTGRASIPSGGIGAAINVITARPLDNGADTGFRGTIGAKAVHDVSVDRGDDITPEISGLISWSDDAETLGVSLFGSYQKRDSAAASSTANAWNIRRLSQFTDPGNGFVTADTEIRNAPSDPNALVSVPNDSRYHFAESERERINGQAVLQFRPTETVTLTADALYARNETSEARSDQTNWFNRPFGQVEFDSNPLVATTVFLQETLSGVKDIGFEQQFRATKDSLESYGLNANWEAFDRLTLSIDAHHSVSRSVPDAPNGASSTLVSMGAPVIAAHSVDYTGAIPVQRYTADDSLRGNNNGVLDLGDIGTQVARTNASSQRQRINQVRADAAWELDGGARFDLGVNFVDSKMTSARTQTQQQLGDWGITNVGDVEQIAPGLLEQFCLACKFDHYKPGDAEIAFRGDAVDLYQALSSAYAEMGNPVNVTGNDFDEVNEKVFAGYVQATWEGEFGGAPVGITGGVRYERTEVTSTALVAVPQAIVWNADNDFSRVVSMDIQTLSESGEYEYLLPAIDFQIEPVDDVIARVSYSRTLARPDYGNLFVSNSANAPPRPTAIGGVATGNAGSPGLKPLLSDNFDVSLEWYFKASSYVSAAFFAKKVKNFVGSGQFDRNLFGLRDPSSGADGTRSGAALAELGNIGADVTDVNLFTLTALIIQNGGDVAAASTEFQANFSGGALSQAFVDQILAEVDVIANTDDPLFNFAVQQPINNRNGNIHGFEIQAQYFFGDTGIGLAGSFTKVNGDVEIDVGADPSVDQFALLGLSDSFNISAIYDNYGLSARLTYNWRDEFLSGTNRGGGDRNPVFVDSFGTLDLNISYDVTEQIAVSFEAINLLSEPVRTYGRDESNLWFAQELKPRYLLGARYRF